MQLNITTHFYENFADAPAKVKFTRAIYFLLILPLVVVAFPVYILGSWLELWMDKLKDWLW